MNTSGEVNLAVPLPMFVQSMIAFKNFKKGEISWDTSQACTL